MKTGIPSFIVAIRTIRTVRNLSFNEALKQTISVYDKKGWEVPDEFRKMVARV